MSHFNAVLVLGSSDQHHLQDSIFDMGFTPLTRSKMDEALYKLRHEKFKAVFIDRDHVDIDALEFILNVRDLDHRIPIIVFGQPVRDYDDQILQRQENVYLLSKTSKELDKEFNAVFSEINHN